jgi:hypothetical protein
LANPPALVYLDVGIWPSSFIGFWRPSHWPTIGIVDANGTALDDATIKGGLNWTNLHFMIILLPPHFVHFLGPSFPFVNVGPFSFSPTLGFGMFCSPVFFGVYPGLITQV